MITHVVLYRLHDPEDLDEAIARLRGMAGRIPSLRSVRAGRDSNSGPAAFELVLITEHDSAEALAAYQQDPYHREIVAWLSPKIRDRAVVDSADLA